MNSAISENRRTVERFMESFGRSEHATYLACLTDDVEWIIPGGSHTKGKEAFYQQTQGPGFTGDPEIHLTRWIEEGDHIVVEGSIRCTRTGGGFSNDSFCDVFVMQDGKIKQMIAYIMQLPE